MCKLFITDIGKLVTPALIRIPASNLVAPVLKDIDDFDETKVKFHIEALDFVYVIETTDRRMLSLLGMDILNRFDLSTHREKKTAALTRLPNAPGRFRAASRSLTY